MLVDPVPQVHMHRLCVLAADRRRAGGKVSPLAADHQVAVVEAHFRVHQLVLLVADHHDPLEAEGALQPVQRGQRVLVEDGRAEGGAAERIVHGSLPGPPARPLQSLKF
ncbi:hypothetical protein D3C72_1837480 [compost metagenome]